MTGGTGHTHPLTHRFGQGDSDHASSFGPAVARTNYSRCFGEKARRLRPSCTSAAPTTLVTGCEIREVRSRKGVRRPAPGRAAVLLPAAGQYRSDRASCRGVEPSGVASGRCRRATAVHVHDPRQREQGMVRRRRFRQVREPERHRGERSAVDLRNVPSPLRRRSAQYPGKCNGVPDLLDEIKYQLDFLLTSRRLASYGRGCSPRKTTTLLAMSRRPVTGQRTAHSGGRGRGAGHAAVVSDTSNQAMR